MPTGVCLFSLGVFEVFFFQGWQTHPRSSTFVPVPLLRGQLRLTLCLHAGILPAYWLGVSRDYFLIILND